MGLVFQKTKYGQYYSQLPYCSGGDFNDVQCNAVHQTITISTGQPISDLINTIRGRLELEDVPLSLYQVHPEEKKMDPALPISKYYKEQPQAEFFHVTVYSR